MSDNLKWTKMDDFRQPDGDYNWKGYYQALIENGETCTTCGSGITWPKGHRSSCYDCQNLERNKDEVCHPNCIRCPYCQSTWDPIDTDNYEICGDGPHDVTCYNCNKDFEITTHVSYSFESPALVEKQEKNNVQNSEKTDETQIVKEDNQEKPQDDIVR